MSLRVSDKGGGGFDPIEPGTYTAVCYSMVDLGTHHDDKFNKDAAKVLIQWELPEVRIQVERAGMQVDLPRAISKRYTASLHKKARLRHDLEAWRGRGFTEEELSDFDLGAIVGASCLLGIIHEQGRDGKTYAGISSILAMPRIKGAAPLKAENPLFTFEIPDQCVEGFDIPDALPEWIAKVIQDSKEWRGEMDWQQADEALSAADAQAADVAPFGDDDGDLMPADEDNLPF